MVSVPIISIANSNEVLIINKAYNGKCSHHKISLLHKQYK